VSCLMSVPHVSDVGCHVLQHFVLRKFQLLVLRTSQRRIAEVTDLSPHVPSNGWSRFTSGLRVLGSSGLSNVCAWKTPEVKIVEVYDLSSRVMTDERPIFTSEVRVSEVSNVKHEYLPEENRISDVEVTW
jgi:hypothetical protein